MTDRWWPWVLRALWVTMPFTVGAAIATALEDASQAIELTGLGLAWPLWAIGVALLLIPSPISLTASRIIVPAALAAATWATVAGDADAAAVIGLGVGAAATLVVAHPAIGEWFVNGAAYGDERRIPLRPPGALLLGPLVGAWALVVGGAVSGPLLIAAEQWVLGVIVTAVGWAGAAFAGRALSGLSNRWLVFVPAGVVVHDAMTVADPVLFKRAGMLSIGPALADSEAEDLTMGALGLALEIELRSAAELTLRRGKHKTARTISAVTVSVARPGRVLELASQRRLPVG